MKAEELANRITPETDWYEFDQQTWCNEAAAELRRQSSEIERLEARVKELEAAELVSTGHIEGMRLWKEKVIQAAEHAYGPSAFRFKFSLNKNGRANNEFPKYLDGRWVSFVYAEDDAHIGYIARALLEKSNG